MNENVWISNMISLKFISEALIDNKPALVQKMAWCRPGDKPFSGIMLFIDACVTRLQCVKWRLHVYLCLEDRASYIWVSLYNHKVIMQYCSILQMYIYWRHVLWEVHNDIWWARIVTAFGWLSLCHLLLHYRWIVVRILSLQAYQRSSVGLLG